MTVDLTGQFKKLDLTRCLELVRSESHWEPRVLDETEEPILKMSVEGWERSDQLKLYGLLQQVGITPKVSEDERQRATSFRLLGDDLGKFKTMCAEYGPLAREIDAKRTVLEAGVWNDGITGNGTLISRIAVGEMDADKQADIKKALTTLGITPYESHSQTLGETIRVVGDDVIEISSLRKEAIETGAKWGYLDIGVKPLYIGELQDKNAKDYSLINNALQGERIEAHSTRMDGAPAFNVLDEASIKKLHAIVSEANIAAPKSIPEMLQ